MDLGVHYGPGRSPVDLGVPPLFIEFVSIDMIIIIIIIIIIITIIIIISSSSSSISIIKLKIMLESNPPGDPLWTWEFHPFNLRLYNYVYVHMCVYICIYMYIYIYIYIYKLCFSQTL